MLVDHEAHQAAGQQEDDRNQHEQLGGTVGVLQSPHRLIVTYTF